MVVPRASRFLRTIPVLIAVCFAGLPAQAQYSGGTGEPNDPYQIATAEDLIALGETPEDYDKHFILTADIDLDPNLPGRKVFDRAVIGAFTLTKYNTVVLIPFTGIFDGNGYTISHLTIAGDYSLGVFHNLGTGGEIKDLGVVDLNIAGSGSSIGGLAGSNCGVLTNCYSTGEVTGDQHIGGLVGYNSKRGSLTNCHSSCAVRGSQYIGGLVGTIAYDWQIPGWGGTLTDCYSTGVISGQEYIGGLVGENGGLVVSSFAACHVSADLYVGGLVGSNGGEFRGDCWPGTIRNCYSRSLVIGIDYVGGVAGYSLGDVTQCYSVGAVSGSTTNVGGLVGVAGECECGSYMEPTWILYGVTDACFWDIETSGQAVSAGGAGKTTAEMQTAETFVDAGWDFVGETENGTENIWKIAEGIGYPRFAWQKYSGGTGEPNDPYQIATADDLIVLGETPEDYDKHFILTADIDLDPNLPGRKVFDRAVIARDVNDAKSDFQGTPFSGVFDGDDYAILNLDVSMPDDDYAALFGYIETDGQIKNLGVLDASIVGSFVVGGMVGRNNGFISNCFSTGWLTGKSPVGGLVGSNNGNIIHCHTTGSVNSTGYAGGLVGGNSANIVESYSDSSVSGISKVGGLVGGNTGSIATSCSTGIVSGTSDVGGLVGGNGGTIAKSYSSSTVSGSDSVGGLTGQNNEAVIDCYSAGSISGAGSWLDGVGGLVGTNWGTVERCYSTAMVSGNRYYVGGLVGVDGYYRWIDGSVSYGWVSGACFWDTQTSGQGTSGGGTGKTTAEMQTANTFLVWGCTPAVWTIDEGVDYPRLVWEGKPGKALPALADFVAGSGSEDDPYLIFTSEELNAIGVFPYESGKQFKLMEDIDLSGIRYSRSVIPGMEGTFDGNSHKLSGLTIQGSDGYDGLFGHLEPGAQVKNLGIVDVNITSARCVGALVADNWGTVTRCYSSGSVRGTESVGGLVGINAGEVNDCYSTSVVSGGSSIGGLVGANLEYWVGESWGGRSPVHVYPGLVVRCYSTGKVSGTQENVGGLVGSNKYSYYGDQGILTGCFWDTQTSGQSTSEGGIGKTTAEMQTASTFLDAGWDFVGETTNSTEYIWWILEGQDYPRLWWEAADEHR